MGNRLSLPLCLHLRTAESLVYLGGRARLVAGDARLIVAAVFLTPATDHAVYPANAFFGGLPIPVMSPAEELLLRRTYFVLPAAVSTPQGAHRRQAHRVIGRARAGEYVKGDGSAPLISHHGAGVHQEGYHLRRRRCPGAEESGAAVQHAGAKAALRATGRVEEPAMGT